VESRHSSARPRDDSYSCQAQRVSASEARKRRYRWYNDYQLPERYGGGDITVRLHGNDEDSARGFNRTENVRPIPPSDDDFRTLYARRNDAESINRGVDDSMYLRRAHSFGHARQHLNLLGYALVVNSLALFEQRRRESEQLATAA
jgi:hypothetical protein